MKIGIDARLWNETGVGRYIRNLIKNLQTIDKTNEYIIFLKSDDLHTASKVINAKNFHIKNVNIHWHSVKEQLLFPLILYKAKLDFVHFPYFSLPVFYRKPFIVTIHDLIIYHFSTGKASTLPLPVFYLKRLAYHFALKRIVKKAVKIIVPLNSVKADIINNLKVAAQRIEVTTEGVDDELINLEKSLGTHQSAHLKLSENYAEIPESQYFLYVGNAYPHKNLDTLIRAFSEFISPSPLIKDSQNDTYQKVSNTKKQIMLVLVGKEDYFYKKTKEQLNKSNITNIKFMHNLNDKDLQILYQKAIAVIAPSIIEGFGLVPLEAMANNCLVIASDIAAHREVCKDAAIYFDPNDINSLTQIMKNVIKSEAADKSIIIKKGKDRVKAFSWNDMAKNTLHIYEQFEK